MPAIKIPQDKLLLFGYFLGLILAGGLLLSLPLAWREATPPPIDAWFLAVSAVCVTGLTTLPVSSMSPLGQTILLVLIQLGGLGVITVTSLLFLYPRAGLSLESRALIKDFFVSPLEYRASRILRKILGITLALEGTGFLLVLALTRGELGAFSTLFHTLSAFNNAGFSLYDDSLWALRAYPGALLALSALVIAGGLGYVVWADLARWVWHRLRRRLNAHTLLVLRVSLTLLVLGMAVFLVLGFFFANREISRSDVLLDAWLNSVMSRTAGFSYLPTTELPPASQIFLIFLMLVGAGPASTSGGIKVTTFILFLHFLFKGHRPEVFLRVGGEEIRRESIQRAVLLFNRFVLVFLAFSTALMFSERYHHPNSGYLPYFFEAASALGTVGLSMGITPGLSFLGKIIIMLAMFTGRVGLMAFIVWSVKDLPPLVRRPRTEVLLG